MMINKIRITFKLLKNYIRDVVIGDQILVGLDAQVKWHADDYQELSNYYLSFSKDPVDFRWDEYGVLDDDVFYYLEGLKEAISFTWRGHCDGWQIVAADLVTSDIAE
jgi:hypothetical protein